jgi:hypothetical protein
VTGRTFETLDRLDVPDLRRDIERRRSVPDELRPIPKPSTGGRRVAAALLALALFAGAAAFGLRVWTRDQGPRPVADPWSWAGEGWTRLPDPPERHPGATWALAADHLLVWGGCTDYPACSPTNEGFSYDPRTRAWTSLPASSRPGHDVLSVTDQGRLYLVARSGEGQMYDMGTGMWAELPAAPIRPDVVVWAGTEIVALQGASRTRGETAAATYDPTTDAWRALSAPPIAFDTASATWDGQEVIVLSGLLEPSDRPTPATVDAMAFDPSTGRWRTLPATGLYPESFASVWSGGELLVWDYYMRWRSFDPGAAKWSAAGTLPLDAKECYVGGAAVGSVVFAWNCGDAAIFDGVRWTSVHGGPLDVGLFSSAYERQIDLWRFADLVPADDVLVLPMEGITLTPSGEACYGCPGSPESLWVYRPPSDAGGSPPAGSG